MSTSYAAQIINAVFETSGLGEKFVESGAPGMIGLGACFIFVQLWKFYAQRKDYRKGESTRVELILASREQTLALKELAVIIKTHDKLHVDTNQRVVEMATEWILAQQLLNIIDKQLNGGKNAEQPID